MKKLLQLTIFICLLTRPGFAQPASELTVPDTRNTATTPSSYSQNLQGHFKYNPAVGLPAVGTGYSTLLGMRGWVADNSGGKAHELAFTDDNQMYIRSGYSPNWEGWRRTLMQEPTGRIDLANNESYLDIGNRWVFPYGEATIGHGSGRNSLIYHHQVQSGTTLKVDVDGYNFSPAVHVSGVGAYLNGGLFNVDYTHYNYVYLTAAYKANMAMTSPAPGWGSVAGFQGDVTTIAGAAYGGMFSSSSTGSGTAFGVYVDASLGSGATGNAWGLYVNRGKNYFQDNVGIGTNNPGSKLEANGTIRVTGATPPASGEGLELVYDNANGIGNIYSYNRGSSVYKAINLNDQMRIHPNGNVTIGTTVPHAERLAVNGDIVSRKIKVSVSVWPDYVFRRGYRLPTLKEVEAFINAENRLPGVPGADEVEKTGLDVGGNQAVLLKKIEELTLYVIDLKKQVDNQERKITGLKNQLNNQRR